MKVRTLIAAAIPAVAAAAVLLGAGAGMAGAATSRPAMSPATISSGSVHHAGHCYAAGAFAICSAGGTATGPATIHVRVTAEPNQKVTGAWDVVCSRGSGVGSRSGSFSGTTPLRRAVRHPFTHPDSCTVSADAQLSKDGNHIKLHITYRR